VGEALATGIGGPEVQDGSCPRFSTKTVFAKKGNGYPALSRAGEGEGGKEEEWHLT